VLWEVSKTEGTRVEELTVIEDAFGRLRYIGIQNFGDWKKDVSSYGTISSCSTWESGSNQRGCGNRMPYLFLGKTLTSR